MSVFCDIGIGWANFATANKSFCSLYKPIVVTYGSKYDAVAKYFTSGSGVDNDWVMNPLPLNKLSCNNVGLYGLSTWPMYGKVSPLTQLLAAVLKPSTQSHVSTLPLA